MNYDVIIAGGGPVVRPDGFVAWATDSSAPDASIAEQALRRWFGVPNGS